MVIWLRNWRVLRNDRRKSNGILCFGKRDWRREEQDTDGEGCMLGSDARSSSVLENGCYVLYYVLCGILYIVYFYIFIFLNEYFIFLLWIH